MIKGSSFHKGAEHDLKQKIKTHEDLPLDQIEMAIADAFDANAAGGLSLTKEEVSTGTALSLGRAKDRVIKFASLFLKGMPGKPETAIAPRIQPVLVEEFITIPLEGHPVDLLGRLDLLDENGVADFKVTGRQWRQREVDESDQLSWYYLAVEHKTGTPPTGVRTELLYDIKGEQSCDVIHSSRNINDKIIFLNRLNAFLAGVRAGIFLPATPGHWQCSPKWCGFWDECPYVNAERLDAAEVQGLA